MADGVFLGMWSRIYIIGGAILIVLFATFAVVCFVNKDCLGYLILTREKRKKARKPFSENASILRPNVQYEKKKHSVYLSTSGTLTAISLEENVLENKSPKKRDSAYSSLSENSYASSEYFKGSANDCRLEEEPECENLAEIEEGPAEMSFYIQYMPLTNKKEVGKLVLTMNEVKKLPGKRYMGGACNPYVTVSITTQKRSLSRKSSTVKSFHTKTIRHTRNPKYDQTFIMDTSYNDLRNFVLKFVVMNEDKYGNSTPLGQTEQTLKDMRNFFFTAEKSFFNLSLSPPQYNNGEVLFALNYLPTAKRLCVTLHKADNLNYSEIVDDISKFYTFIRILLLSPSGRIFRKKKTSVKGKTDKPVWNQTLIFDLGSHKLENITFMLIMCTLPIDANGIVSSLHNGGSMKNSSQVDKDKYIGKVVLGMMVSQEEKIHWEDIISSPRTMISKWHALK